MVSSCSLDNLSKLKELENEAKLLDSQRKDISSRIEELNGGDPLVTILQIQREDLDLEFNLTDAKIKSLKRSMEDKSPMLRMKRKRTEDNLEVGCNEIIESRDPVYQRNLLASMRQQKNRQQRLDLALRAEGAKKVVRELDDIDERNRAIMSTDLREGNFDLVEQQILISEQAIKLKNTVQSNHTTDYFDEVCAPHPIRAVPRSPKTKEGLPSPNMNEKLAPGQCRFRPCSFWGNSARERDSHHKTCKYN